MKADTVYMKELNKNNVRRQLRLKGKATKPELAANTGLSVVTINSLLTELEAEGEVYRGESVPSNGGRPSVQYIYNEKFRYAVIIYGHQRRNQNLIQLLVINLYGKCVERKSRYFPTVETDSFDEWLTDVFEKHDNIGLIAFGLPGEEINGVVTINDYHNIIGAEFMRHYREAYQVPILFENDINAAVTGYYSYGILEDMKNVTGIYFPRIYSPGAGIIINGEIYRGTGHLAGELGKLPIDCEWEMLDYGDKDSTGLAISRLLMTLYCVLAPDCMVLYGDFWTEEIKAEIVRTVRDFLDNTFPVRLIFKESLEEDFEQGMVKLALDALEKQFMGGKTE